MKKIINGVNPDKFENKKEWFQNLKVKYESLLFLFLKELFLKGTYNAPPSPIEYEDRDLKLYRKPGAAFSGG